MTAQFETSWSQISRWRTECFQRFGPIHAMPIVPSPATEFVKLLQPTSRVLDIGAGVDQPLRKALDQPGQRYYSLDVDPRGTFDFRTVEDIPEDVEFDIMVANQVFEHLTIPDAFATLRGSFAHLSDGGYCLADVPNAAHPVRQWGDATHITAWPVFDFYGLFREVGFQDIQVARYNKFPLPRNPLRRWIIRVVSDAFRIDWCDSLLIIGRKMVSHKDTPDGQS